MVLCRKSTTSSSTKLLWLMVPLILVSGFVALIGSKNTNWVYDSRYYPWVLSSVISSYNSASVGTVSRDEQSGGGAVGAPVLSPEKGGGGLDWQPAVTGQGSGEGIKPTPSSSPVAVKDVETQPLVVNKGRISNITSNGPVIFPSLNESHSLPLTARIQSKYTSLDRLEAGLARARAAIKEAKNQSTNQSTPRAATNKAKNGGQSDHPDYVPSGPIYLNPVAFHRSYLEMEKQFKVFVYEEGEPPVFHNGPCKSIYAMEGNFIYHLETSKFRTRDPDKAHVHFLPISVTSIVRYVYERDSHDWHPMKQTVIDYVNLLAGKYPYWNRSAGADHFMLACHDWGPELSSAVPNLFKNSIRALCNANTSEGFKPSIDVSIPEILLPGGTMDGLLDGPSPSHRPVLVFFAGGLHGPIRPILLEHWENKDEEVQVHKYLPKGVSYYGMLRKSRYCICPSGYEVASPRMVEALYTGCVPVLIKENYVAPFSDVLNWKSFAVEIPVKDIPNLKKILSGISSRQYIRMQRRGTLARRHFEVNLPPKRYDVFHMILHSVWLRRLNIQIHGISDS